MSRITARETTMPAPAEMPCTTRQNTSAAMLSASAQPAETMVNSATPEHDRLPPDAVGQRAVEQVHDREAEQVARQGLLHLHRRRAGRAAMPANAGR